MAAALTPEQRFVAAAKAGNVARVGALLDQGVDIERGEAPHGMRALHWSCWGGHREVVTLLLGRGADIDARTMSRETPIMNASSEGHLEIVKLLYARGGNIHLVDAHGVSALYMAARSDHLPVCTFLLSKGMDLMEGDNTGNTVLSAYGMWAEPSLSRAAKELKCANLKIASGVFQIATLRSTIEAFESTIETQHTELVVVKRANAALLFSDSFSDLVFVCPGGERIHAHRNIVSACSPKARALLQGSWAENTDERVTVVQMPQSATAVRALLRFMYTAEIDAASIQMSMSDLLELASQHEQPELKAACEQHAIAALSAANVLPVLVAAHLHNMVLLKEACFRLVMASVQNALTVSTSKDFRIFEEKHPELFREMLGALGLPEEEEEDEDEGEDDEDDGEEEEEGRDRKRA